MNKVKIVNDVEIGFWTAFYEILRRDGEWMRADQLREMLRRMGYEVVVTKEGVLTKVK